MTVISWIFHNNVADTLVRFPCHTKTVDRFLYIITCVVCFFGKEELWTPITAARSLLSAYKTAMPPFLTRYTSSSHISCFKIVHSIHLDLFSKGSSIFTLLFEFGAKVGTCTSCFPSTFWIFYIETAEWFYISYQWSSEGFRNDFRFSLYS